MKAPRDILKHVCIEVAKAKRKCYRDSKHQILKGDRCLIVKEGAFGSSKNYCCACAENILDAARIKQEVLSRSLARYSGP